MKQRRRGLAEPRGGKRAAPRARTARAVRGKPAAVPQMLWQIVVCGALFVALVGLKLVMPGHLSDLRGTLGQWLVRVFCRRPRRVGRADVG